MKTIIKLTIVFICCVYANAGSEPPFSRSIPERVRMATHVITGEVQALQVINDNTGKVITPTPQDLENGQRIELEIRVVEVLLADKARVLKAGNKIKVRFGRRGLTPGVFRKMLVGKNLVFYLSRDEEHASRFDYFFPFFGESNLADLAEELDLVKAAVDKQRHLSE